MPHLVDWQCPDPSELVQRLLPVLADGEIVVFPSETTYLAACCPFMPQAVAAMPGDAALAVSDLAMALDWAPDLGKTGRRLAKRCWPGPLILHCADTAAPRLPESVRASTFSDQALRLRCPAHEALRTALDLLPWPLAVASVSHEGQPATTAEMARLGVGDRAALIIDDGPTRYAREATVVHVRGEQWRLVSEGAFPLAVIEKLAPTTILFVCTGNTCRSPLAEALCKKMLAEKLTCKVEELPQRGIVVLSAGLQAMTGLPAALEAVTVATALGADLNAHQSQPVTADLLHRADHVIGMTQNHVRTVAAYMRGNARPRLLASDGRDLPDPIGSSEEVYRECAQMILHNLEELLPELRLR